MMPKGVFVADTCDAQGIPDFIPAGKRDRVSVERPNRLLTVFVDGRESPSAVLHFLQLRDSLGQPIKLGVQQQCVWWVTADGMADARARRLLKWIKGRAQVATMAQLRADTRPAAVTVKASPDLRRPASWDAAGNVTSWETKLGQTRAGFGDVDSAEGTNVGEIDGATEEGF